MTNDDAVTTVPKATISPRYRLPGIERAGIAQLSLLETALWPLQGGKRLSNQFATQYDYSSNDDRKTAFVTIRTALGLQPIDELFLWGLLGATLKRKDAEPVLLATPYWMLRHLGLETGGSQYGQLRESLVRLAVTSYQNTAFYNPETHEHEYAAFQFLSILLPTVGGVGETVDNDRCWRIEWNSAFFRFCRSTGGNFLFDLDVYRTLSPGSRRLFLKLKDRFWRSKRVFMNVDELTVHGLGFSASRSVAKRKFDLLNCIRELLDANVISLGKGHTDPKELFQRHGEGSYVVVFYPGPYFLQPVSERTTMQKNAIADDPLYEPLRRIGVDGPAIRRLLENHNRGMIQRWIRIADAAMHEHPKGFHGFKVSAAAFLIDGVQNARTPPDWMFAHEKRQEQRQWEQQRGLVVAEEHDLHQQFNAERAAALRTYLASREGRQKFNESYPTLLAFFKVTDPNRYHKAAHDKALERIEQTDFRFPDFDTWVLSRELAQAAKAE